MTTFIQKVTYVVDGSSTEVTEEVTASTPTAAKNFIQNHGEVLKLSENEKIVLIVSDMYSLGVIFYALAKCYCEDDLE